jgi:hypothetical protein
MARRRRLVVEEYKEPPDVLCRPPYFGEREDYPPRTIHFASATLAGKVGLRTLLLERGRFEWVPLIDDLKLRRGRPPAYDRAKITAVAEELIAGRGPDEHCDWFIDRVAGELERRGIAVPKDTVLTEICAPIYKRALVGK